MNAAQLRRIKAIFDDHAKRQRRHPQEPLPLRMYRLAEAGHPRAADLFVHAQALELIAHAWTRNLAGPGQFVAVWARARRLWCSITGEWLI